MAFQYNIIHHILPIKSSFFPAGIKRTKSDNCTLSKLKVPITPKHFFGLNKSLNLFKTHSAFLN